MIETKVSEFTIRLCSRKHIEKFIENWHYSGSINGCNSSYHFALYRNSEMIGALFYGRMAMAGQYKRFSDNIDDVIELRRLCCIDDTPKNTESFFIAKTLKWLKRNTNHKYVVSYADEEYGHSGIIYKASNFKYEEFIKGAKVILYQGKKYHDRSTRIFCNGKQKPFSKVIKKALDDGIAQMVETKGKHVYLYILRKYENNHLPKQNSLDDIFKETN